jgi:asparagine synthase (glutamine-hydrolysing)
MHLIGGLAFWDPSRPVTTPELGAMVCQVPGVQTPRYLAHGSVGFFTTGQSNHSTQGETSELVSERNPRTVEQSNSRTVERISVIAALDLTNSQELQALVGKVENAHELLAALYNLDGPAFVRRLRGAFAVALWDWRQRSLLLAADQFGIKRLYYATSEQCTAFACRLRAILGAPGVEKSVNPAGVYMYLNFDFIPAPESIFTGIRRLPPGHVLLLRQGEGAPEPYWDMAYPEQPVSKADGAARIFRLTEEAVARTLQGMRPDQIGAYLSGGTDSSTVLGLMGRLTRERVRAFSIGFREEGYDELDYARLAARHFSAAHHTHIVTPEEALEWLPRLVEAFDEPFGNNSAVGTFFCARLARETGSPLLLAGDGGDEIFGGNKRYCTDRIFARYHRIPAILRQTLVEPIILNLPDGEESLVGRMQRYIRRASIPNPRRFFSYKFFVAQQADRLLSPDFRAVIPSEAPYALVQDHYDRIPATAELNRLLYLDLKLTIGDNDLFKVTRTAELAGVGVRFPMLEIPLVEFTGTLPSDLKVRGMEKRYIFKQAFRTLLPPETLAKQKHGFGVPTSVWIKDHPGFLALVRETLLSPRARQRGYFQADAIQQLLQWHAADSTSFFGNILWTMLMLELWHRCHLDGDAVA